MGSQKKEKFESSYNNPPPAAPPSIGSKNKGNMNG